MILSPRVGPIYSSSLPARVRYSLAEIPYTDKIASWGLDGCPENFTRFPQNRGSVDFESGSMLTAYGKKNLTPCKKLKITPHLRTRGLTKVGKIQHEIRKLNPALIRASVGTRFFRVLDKGGENSIRNRKILP